MSTIPGAFMLNIVSNFASSALEKYGIPLAVKFGWLKDEAGQKFEATLEAAAVMIAEDIGYESVGEFFKTLEVQETLIRRLCGESPNVDDLAQQLEARLGRDWLVFHSLRSRGISLSVLVERFFHYFNRAALRQAGPAMQVLSQQLADVGHSLSGATVELKQYIKEQVGSLRDDLTRGTLSAVPSETPTMIQSGVSAADDVQVSLISVLERLLGERLIEARELLDRGELGSATERFKSLIAEIDGNPIFASNKELCYKAWNGLGVSFSRSLQHPEARQAFETAVGCLPTEKRGKLNLLSTRYLLDEDAQVLLPAVLAEYADDPSADALNLLLHLYSDIGMPQVGLSLYQTASSDVQASLSVRHALVLVYQHLGNHQEALVIAREALQRDPADPTLALTYGTCLMHQVEQLLDESEHQLTADVRTLAAEADQFLQLAVDGADTNRDLRKCALINQIAAKTWRGEPGEGVRIAEACTHLADPDDRLALEINHAFALLGSGDIPGALIHFEVAHMMAPGNPVLSFNLAQCHIHHGKPETAITLLEEQLAAPCGDGDKLLLSILLLRAKVKTGVDDPEVLLNELDGAFPNSPQVWVERGRYALRTNQFKKAKNWFRQALQGDPEDTEASYWLASVLERQHKWREASKAFSRVVSLYQSSHEVPPEEVLLALAHAQYQARDFEKALNSVSDAKSLGVKSMDLEAICAESYSSLGRFADAIEHYSLYLEALPDKVWAWANLAHAYTRLGKIPQAIRALEKVKDLEPHNAHPFAVMSTLYLLLGDQRKAYLAADQGRQREPNNSDVLSNFCNVALKTGHTREATEAIRVFAGLFPNDARVTVWHGQSTQLAERLLEEFVHPNARREETALSLYAERHLPVVFLHKTLRMPLVQSWRRLTHGMARVYSNRGIDGEVQEQLDILRGTQKVVVDPVALFTLSELNLLSVIPELFPEACVSQTTLDQFHSELLAAPEERGLLSPILDAITTGNGGLVPVSDVVATRQRRFRRLSGILGEATVGTIAVASESGACIYAEDLGTQDMAREFGVTGFSTRAVLEVARQRNLLDLTTYYRCLRRLLHMNYSWIVHDSELLIWVLREGGLGDSPDAERIIAQAFEPDASPEKFANYFAGAVTRLWLDDFGITPSKVNRWTHRLLDAVNALPDKSNGIVIFTGQVLAVLTTYRPDRIAKFLGSVLYWGARGGVGSGDLLIIVASTAKALIAKLPSAEGEAWLRKLLSGLPVYLRSNVLILLDRSIR